MAAKRRMTRLEEKRRNQRLRREMKQRMTEIEKMREASIYVAKY